MMSDEEEEKRAKELVTLVKAQKSGTNLILQDHIFSKTSVDSWYDPACATYLTDVGMAEEIAYKEACEKIWSFS